MKVLFVTSEARPFAATGGLGDVAGSLPQAIRSRLVGCRVVMPLYEDIPQDLKDTMRFVTSLSVPVSWRRQYCGIFEAKYNGVTYYLLDNQYYFKRQGLYGHYDDAERFAFLSRAAIEIIPYIDFKPDVIHSNDWQTALLPVYYKLFYQDRPGFEDIKTLFTIHNIQYQGQYGMEILEDVFGLPQYARSIVEFDGDVNEVKGAIQMADWVSTVSPTYAQELLDPWFSHGLDPVLRENQGKMSGILNGIDTQLYNPEKDDRIYAAYSTEDLSGKAENKKCLQERMGLPVKPDVPVMGMVTRLVSHKGLDLVKYILDELLSTEDIQMVVLGSGDWVYENFFQEMQAKYPDKLAVVIGFIPELSHKIYAGSDLFLMPSKSEPCGLSQMIALRYGSIPIVRETGGLKDSIFDSGDGKGNGFTFKSYNAHDMLAAIRRAIAGYYSSKEGWATLVDRAMKCDNSWGKSANEYIRLYKSLCGK
ncbi:glycogen synthase GlgA [Solibaculum mannosilyticum]|uniref:Glycogen synthase n=1 Tax=Solibaculum mannosilyticum TaxID=2780922 RepID=A0A7I8CZY2_9FIRM|nr:glycogen synthase GlgA [Solibaculum mannosilyticum]MCO7137925.1 glycogen synthase GlgA [[Clostridium] leptum]BCI60006.1 glycogen synthase [Solibaculum mannosilyticum]CZT57388.1 Glycogen synthase [Eubacteriaceae bacterium CHKCI005]